MKIEKQEEGKKEVREVGKNERGDGRTNGRTNLAARLPHRNIKLNKRSIFCSLFLTGVELRHFATLFSLRSLRPSVSLPLLYYPLPLPLPRALPPCFFPSLVLSSSFPALIPFPLLPPFPPPPLPPPAPPPPPPPPPPSPLSPPALFRSSRVSLFFSLRRRPVRRNEPRRGEALYQSRVRSAWFIFYFGRGPNCKINTYS